MTRQEHLIAIIAEECMEVGQRAIKALRFGLDEVQPGQELTNDERIMKEFTDLVGVINMLSNEGGLNYKVTGEGIDAKIAKVEKFLAYSKECGTLS